MKLEIKKLDINGHGIGYHNRKLVFVKGALLGETVEAVVERENENHILAIADEIIVKAADRVRTKCKVQRKCGGCSLMHLNYKSQLQYKENKVLEAFQKYTNLNVKVSNCVGAENTFNYRNKANLAVKTTNRVMIGLYEEGSNYIVDVKDCDIQDKKINFVINELRPILEKARIKALTNLIIKVNDEEAQVIFILDRDRKMTREVEQFKNIKYVTSIFKIVGENLEHLYGKTRIIKKIGDKNFYIRPKDFFQLNDEQTKKLYDYIKTLIKDEKKILDCYAGVGTIGQYVCTTQDLRGIEIVKSAVESARENAKVNKVEAKYACGSTKDVLKRWSKENYSPDLMIFDPPRAGLDEESIKSIILSKVKNVIYVSCNPSTLAKDINILSKKYKIVSIQLFDMFPNTAHVESVVLLEKK